MATFVTIFLVPERSPGPPSKSRSLTLAAGDTFTLVDPLASLADAFN